MLFHLAGLPRPAIQSETWRDSQYMTLCLPHPNLMIRFTTYKSTFSTFIASQRLFPIQQWKSEKLDSIEKTAYTQIIPNENKTLKKMFGAYNYIVMGKNNSVIGVYKLGEERQLIARYKEHLCLI